MLLVKELNVVEYNVVPFPAVGALNTPELLGAAIVGCFNITASLNRRSGDFDGFFIVEGRLSGFGEFPRIAFRSSTERPAITLVAENIANWS